MIRQDLGDRLRAEADGKGLRVLTGPHSFESAEVLGRLVPQGVSWARLALYLGTLTLLVHGPQSWRARRWAWFWLMSVFGLQSVGVLAFLALSGPTPMLAQPRPGRRRLRGGRALVLALLCAGLG